MTAKALTRSELDITKRDAVQREISNTAPKVIINAAAYTAVDKAERDEEMAFAINRDGPRILAETAEKTGALLLHISTDYVFNGTKPSPYLEDDPVAPLGVYGRSKEAGEAAIRNSTDRHIILRTSWVYGVHGHNFVKTMLRLGADRDKICVVGDQKGAPTYAFDLAEVILHLARRITSNDFFESGLGTFHCTGSGETTWHEFARKIFELSGQRLAKTPKLVAIPTSQFLTPAKRPANSVLNCTRLKQVHDVEMRPWPHALFDMLNSLDYTYR